MSDRAAATIHGHAVEVTRVPIHRGVDRRSSIAGPITPGLQDRPGGQVSSRITSGAGAGIFRLRWRSNSGALLREQEGLMLAHEHKSKVARVTHRAVKSRVLTILCTFAGAWWYVQSYLL